MRDRIIELFESTIAPQPKLKKVELSDEQFQRVLAAKPGDINIILARVVAIIEDSDPEKSKKELTDDILETLDRSQAARMFEGVGLKEQYHLFRGFPVRVGEPHERLPSQGEDIEIDKNVQYQSWTTDAATGREIATTYDQTKGEPVGGLLVDTHVQDEKILHDINAVMRTCKIKRNAIVQYNQKAAQGKAISEKNVDKLIQMSEYNGIYEVLTSSEISHVRVTDVWTWDESTGTKTPQWQTTADANPEPEVPAEPEQDVAAQQQSAERPVAQPNRVQGNQ